MASVIIIPILIVTIIGLSGYLAYRFLIYDLFCKRSVNKSLRKYDIKKLRPKLLRNTMKKGRKITHDEIQKIEKITGRTSLINSLQCMMQSGKILGIKNKTFQVTQGLTGICMNGVPPSPTTRGSWPSHVCVFSHSK